MKLELTSGLLGKQKYVIMAAMESDFDSIAQIHAASFPRGWTKLEFSKLAAKSTNTLLVARAVGKPNAPIAGFNLIQQTIDEAEILSIAVDPKHRRKGLAAAMMREIILRLQGDRLKALLLEVDGTNVAAVMLYEKLGFKAIGSRPGYYKKTGEGDETQRATALVMRLELVS
ncbi:MAG: ribosomal protein S18-alanine N-acetyltransferase [Rhizobiaceae bacterium]